MNRSAPRVGGLGVAVIGALLVGGVGIVAWKDRSAQDPPPVARPFSEGDSATFKDPSVLEPLPVAGPPAQGAGMVYKRKMVAGEGTLIDSAEESNVDDKSDKAAGWGNVKGQIVLDAATPPAVAELSVTKDQEACLAKGPLLSEDLIVNKSNLGIKNVFVWLIPIDPEKPLAVHPDLQKIKQKAVVVDQPCCTFVPHALCLREGQDLVAKNTATIAHNFHWTGFPLKNPGGNQIVAAGSELKIEPLAADQYPIAMSCDIHPWMKGWVRVFDHPYFALTDADGKYEIKNAPAGPCRIAIWQEKNGWIEGYGKVEKITGKEVSIPAGKTLDLGVVKMPLLKE